MFAVKKKMIIISNRIAEYIYIYIPIYKPNSINRFYVYSFQADIRVQEKTINPNTQ